MPSPVVHEVWNTASAGLMSCACFSIVATRARCDDCTREFDVAALVFRCPFCGGPRIRLIAGDELQVVAVELEDTQPEVT